MTVRDLIRALLIYDMEAEVTIEHPDSEQQYRANNVEGCVDQRRIVIRPNSERKWDC